MTLSSSVRGSSVPGKATAEQPPPIPGYTSVWTQTVTTLLNVSFFHESWGFKCISRHDLLMCSNLKDEQTKTPPLEFEFSRTKGVTAVAIKLCVLSISLTSSVKSSLLAVSPNGHRRCLRCEL